MDEAHLLSVITSYFKDTIFENHKNNVLKEHSSLKSYKINPILVKYLSKVLEDGFTPLGIAKALYFPRVLGTSITTSFGTRIQKMFVELELAQGSLIPEMDIEFIDTLSVIFTSYTPQGYSVEQIRTHIDGFTMATPLDTVKTNLTLGLTVVESMQAPTIGEHLGVGWEWIPAGFLLGGLFLLSKKAIHWTTPLSFLASLFICSFIAFIISPDSSASTMFHWFTGATMLGAFFILTDPVSGATSVKGRLIFGALAGLLVYLIRKFGGYPDAIAFAVLLCNMAAPLIDQYTRPRTYGHDVGAKK